MGLSAVFGWTSLLLPRMLFPQVQSWDDVLGILLSMVIFGLPVALPLVVIFVAWPWHVLMRRHLSYRRSAL